MGNQHSYVNEHQNSEDKLLRRNFHKGGCPSPNPSACGTISPYHQRLGEINDSHRSRAKSLEPHPSQEIRVIEHSKSARYGKRQNAKRSQQLSQQTSWRIWDPEEHRKSIISQQLQNPTSANNIVALPTISQQQQQLAIVVDSALINQTDLNSDITEQEQTLRSITGLSTHQIQILQKIWARTTQKDALDCGRNIFLHLLRSNVFMYQFFNLMEMSDKEILNSEIYARQAANFASVFDFVINNIGTSSNDQLDNVCLSLQALGERHYRIVPHPIEAAHWTLFTRVFEDNPLKLVFQNATGHTVWKTLIGFIVRQMRIGYDRAMEATSAVWAPKKLSVGEAYLNASQHRNSSFSINPTPPNSPYQRSLSVHNTAHHPPLSPGPPIRSQAKKSVADFSKSAAKRFSIGKRGLTMD